MSQSHHLIRETILRKVDTVTSEPDFPPHLKTLLKSIESDLNKLARLHYVYPKVNEAARRYIQIAERMRALEMTPEKLENHQFIDHTRCSINQQV